MVKGMKIHFYVKLLIFTRYILEVNSQWLICTCGLCSLWSFLQSCGECWARMRSWCQKMKTYKWSSR